MLEAATSKAETIILLAWAASSRQFCLERRLAHGASSFCAGRRFGPSAPEALCGTEAQGRGILGPRNGSFCRCAQRDSPKRALGHFKEYRRHDVFLSRRPPTPCSSLRRRELSLADSAIHLAHTQLPTMFNPTSFFFSPPQSSILSLALEVLQIERDGRCRAATSVRSWAVACDGLSKRSLSLHSEARRALRVVAGRSAGWGGGRAWQLVLEKGDARHHPGAVQGLSTASRRQSLS